MKINGKKTYTAAITAILVAVAEHFGWVDVPPEAWAALAGLIVIFLRHGLAKMEAARHAERVIAMSSKPATDLHRARIISGAEAEIARRKARDQAEAMFAQHRADLAARIGEIDDEIASLEGTEEREP